MGAGQYKECVGGCGLAAAPRQLLGLPGALHAPASQPGHHRGARSLHVFFRSCVGPVSFLDPEEGLLQDFTPSSRTALQGCLVYEVASHSV